MSLVSCRGTRGIWGNLRWSASSVLVVVAIANCCGNGKQGQASDGKNGKAAVSTIAELLELGQYDQALAECDAAIKRNPRDADAHCYRGDALLRGFDMVEDATAFSIYLKKSGATTSKQQLELQADEVEQQSEAAVAAYTAALKLDPSITEALVGRAMAFTLRGEHELALADIDAALERKADDDIY